MFITINSLSFNFKLALSYVFKISYSSSQHVRTNYKCISLLVCNLSRSLCVFQHRTVLTRQTSLSYWCKLSIYKIYNAIVRPTNIMTLISKFIVHLWIFSSNHLSLNVKETRASEEVTTFEICTTATHVTLLRGHPCPVVYNEFLMMIINSLLRR